MFSNFFKENLSLTNISLQLVNDKYVLKIRRTVYIFSFYHICTTINDFQSHNINAINLCDQK